MWQFLAADRRGVTAIEYALMASLVAVAIVGGVGGYTTSLGTYMTNTFSRISGSL